MGNFNFLKTHKVSDNISFTLLGWWCKILIVVFLTLEIVSTSPASPRATTHIEFNEHMPAKWTHLAGNLGHVHAFNSDQRHQSVTHVNALNSNQRHESESYHGLDDDREGKLLGILGNWGYGYPGFGRGAYGGLCKGGRKHSSRCRPGLGPRPFENY